MHTPTTKPDTCPVATPGCARPGRRCPHFVLNWRYTEVFKILLHHKNSIHIDFLQPELFSQGREIF